MSYWFEAFQKKFLAVIRKCLTNEEISYWNEIVKWNFRVHCPCFICLINKTGKRFNLNRQINYHAWKQDIVSQHCKSLKVRVVTWPLYQLEHVQSLIYKIVGSLTNLGSKLLVIDLPIQMKLSFFKCEFVPEFLRRDKKWHLCVLRFTSVKWILTMSLLFRKTIQC